VPPTEKNPRIAPPLWALHILFLMTGTGIVPPSDFTLQAGDSIEIDIAGVGRLVNSVGHQ